MYEKDDEDSDHDGEKGDVIESSEKRHIEASVQKSAAVARAGQDNKRYSVSIAALEDEDDEMQTPALQVNRRRKSAVSRSSLWVFASTPHTTRPVSAGSFTSGSTISTPTPIALSDVHHPSYKLSVDLSDTESESEDEKEMPVATPMVQTPARQPAAQSSNGWACSVCTYANDDHMSR